MIATEWDEAAAWINLRWDRQPLDPVVAKTWFPFLADHEYDDVLAAINRLVVERPIRPSVSELVAATKAVVAGKGTPQLPPHIAQSRPYGTAWYAVGVAAREGRLPKAELDRLAEKHNRWFGIHGQDTKATAEMIAEVEALASRADVRSTGNSDIRAPEENQGRYSDAHKARYLAAVEAKQAAEQKAKGVTA